jgi:hypothetical protein
MPRSSIAIAALLVGLSACGAPPRAAAPAVVAPTSPRAGVAPPAAMGPMPAMSDLPPAAVMMIEASKLPPTDDDRFGALGIGADYAGYQKLTAAPFLSRVHGDRWVDVYVNAIGADAYLRGDPIPIGTTIVKASWENIDGAPSTMPGPTFVMQKRAPDQGDWSFAVYWPAPPAMMAAMIGGPVYWRGASPRVGYCRDCHDSYDRGVGGLVPTSVLPR